MDAAQIAIVCDHVADDGDLVEFEFTGDAQHAADATTRLGQFITSLDIALGELINCACPHPARP